MKKLHLNLIIIFLLVLLAGAVASPMMPDFSIFGKDVGKTLRDMKIKLGLDLQGGAHLVYKADLSQIPEDNREESLAGARDVIERRVNAYGIAEPQIRTNQDGDEFRIIVDLAGVEEISSAIKMIGETPILDFREPLTEEDLKLTPEEQNAAKAKNALQKKLAEEVLARALAGENFEELAKEYSQDPGSAATGGDLDFFAAGEMVGEFDDAAFNKDFQKGTVWPQLVKTDFGYHILKKIDEREVTEAELEAQRGEDAAELEALLGEVKGEEGAAENPEEEITEAENAETAANDEEKIEQVRVSHILLKTENEEQRTLGYGEMPFKLTDLTGKNLESAQVVFDQNTQQPEVSLQFDSEGARLFKELTERNLHKQIAIFLDNEPVTVPTVQSVISDGRAVITGSSNIQEARELAKRLNAGALPVPVELLSQEKVGASLGRVSLEQSLKAGLVGVAVVAGFMLVFYLGFGLVADISLLIYAVFMVAIFKILGITLTLSGIAGFILSVGMAVDANILIFARIREELRQKQALPQAVQNGFKRAWSSIRDGNVSTLITCFILAGIGTGMIKGFAITLGIGVALSMFTAVFITRNFLEFLAKVWPGFLLMGNRGRKKDDD